MIKTWEVIRVMLEMQKTYSEYKFVDTKSFSGQSIFDLQLRHWAVTDSRTFSSQHLSGKCLMFLNWFVSWDLLWPYRSSIGKVLKSKAFCILRSRFMCKHCTDARLLGNWGGASTASEWNCDCSLSFCPKVFLHCSVTKEANCMWRV